MSIYATLRSAILSGSPSPVAAIVGDRVYADELPDPAVLPAVVMLLVAAPRLGTHLGGSGRLALALMQVDCWAATRATAEQLASAVEDAVESALGADATLQDRRDEREPQSVLAARRVILEYHITTTET